MNRVHIVAMKAPHLVSVVTIEEERFETPWTEQMFRQEVEDDHLSRSYVALRDDTVVGYLVSWFLLDEVRLLNVAVAKASERQGHGQQMLRFLVERAVVERRETITLEVREGNTAARSLYNRNGFKIVAKHTEYYGEDEEDAVIMALDLRERLKE